MRFCFFAACVTAVLFFGATMVGAQTSVPTPVATYSVSRAYEPRVLPTPEKQETKKKKKSKNEQETEQQNTAKPAAAETVPPAAAESKPISISVSVLDSSGKPVTGLQPSDFKVFIDEREETITSVAAQHMPLNIILLFDTSPSTQLRLKEMQQLAADLVNKLQPDDRVSVATFNEKFRILTDLTTDRAVTDKAISKLTFGDGTAIYEAVAELFGKRLRSVSGSKAVIIFTDGIDTTSRGSTYESSLVEAEKSDAVIYAVYWDTLKDMNKQGTVSQLGISRAALQQIINSNPSLRGGSAGNTQAESDEGKSYLNDLISLSGGRVVANQRTKKGIIGPTADIPQELNSQYIVSVKPSGTETPGQRRKVRIAVNRPNLIVLARGSYIVSAN